ncbi:hypothetical protein Vafri_9184 [Volvox africanus]|uniref:Receptor L-domain domain-containing protein n=1 Tax=Volvox africanus TaxID=51714 RepID=A0A8J4F178_9CHLO|nr:hypothetical protein Vafri_9184 [Volvox africanus]
MCYGRSSRAVRVVLLQLLATLVLMAATTVTVTDAAQQTQLSTCAGVPTLVVYAGSGGIPDLVEVYDELPLDKKGLLPLGQSQVAMMNLEAPTCSLNGVALWPGNLLLYDNGTLSKALPVLGSLTAVSGTLMLYGHAGLGGTGIRSLQGISNIKSAANLLVYNMDALADLRGLEGFTSLPGDLYLADNARLRTLVGLDGLINVGGDLALLSNMGLISVQGLQNLQTVGGQLVAIGNGKLTDLLALLSLTSIGSMKEANNGDVRLELPEAVRMAPATAFAPTATAVPTAAPGTTVGAGSGTPPAVQNSGSVYVLPASDPASPPTWSPGITREAPQPDRTVVLLYGGTPPLFDELEGWLRNFDPPMEHLGIREYNTRLIHLYGDSGEVKQLSVISGSLVIWANGDIGTGLWPLRGLTAVYGQLVILGARDGSSTLETLQGLDNLQYVGGLHLVYLNQLRNLTGLGSLRTVRGDLNILFCASLQSTRGLGPLTSIYTDLYLKGNRGLWDMSGFRAIRSIGWDLHLQDMPYIKNLEGLSAVQTVYGEIVIKNCSQLTSTSGLKSLSQIGVSVALLWNDALSDVSGLSRLSQIPGDLQLTGNPSLQSLQPLSSLTTVGLNLVLSSCRGLQDMKGLGEQAATSANRGPDLRVVRRGY